MTLAPGTRLGPYVIEAFPHQHDRRLGRGVVAATDDGDELARGREEVTKMPGFSFVPKLPRSRRKAQP